ncbi:hypothetical protein KDK95_15900 [Actinospica sp. MGRD01-02]|uniref:B3/B4 tRNA-binding domain-containing protein n=1 Tax=Actinospica acidithermotolerans TaxID=2828514 RepID=A0A941IK63_9ACTN|nr:phenylalanine--tRNA ligase beta subunit-related protein [Actinospica acidithermotolerans]MBR7827803.1 hypothetical protein [Actinospica acidithermotolerans]
MPPTISYAVSDEVFERFPGYRRGVVIARGLRNGPAAPELLAELRAEEERLHKELDAATIAQHPRIEPWRDAFRAFGSKPSDFRPSVEALARRAARGDQLPSVSSLVDLGTLACLHNLMPIGAHSLDEVTGDIELRIASGREHFTAFGSTESETPRPGEVILAEGDTVLTRRWAWRQANHTLVVDATRVAVINVDALSAVPDDDLAGAMAQVLDLLRRFCGGTAESTVLTSSDPSVRIDLSRAHE